MRRKFIHKQPQYSYPNQDLMKTNSLTRHIRSKTAYLCKVKRIAYGAELFWGTYRRCFTFSSTKIWKNQKNYRIQKISCRKTKRVTENKRYQVEKAKASQKKRYIKWKNQTNHRKQKISSRKENELDKGERRKKKGTTIKIN